MHPVKPDSQFYGQTFSSSVYLTPDGEVIKSSIFKDTLGNHVVNGEALQKKPFASMMSGGGGDGNKVQILTRPAWDVSF